jgi:hypothetical protein
VPVPLIPDVTTTNYHLRNQVADVITTNNHVTGQRKEGIVLKMRDRVPVKPFRNAGGHPRAHRAGVPEARARHSVCHSQTPNNDETMMKQNSNDPREKRYGKDQRLS